MENVKAECEEVCVELQNSDLWNKFHEHKTEMIVTKMGRRMFPYIRVSISGLDPTAYYCVMLQFNLASNHRFKYYASTGWTLAGSEEKHHNQRVYVHPESPSTGSHWMSQTVSFAKAKLSNTMSPPPGMVVLSSMHQYQPTIVIMKTIDPRATPWMSPKTVVAFPETQFIAVTAYQNAQVTKLKIEYNPFAKGFRENEEGKMKRKRAVKEDDIKRENTDSSSNSSSPSLEMMENRVIESRLSQFTTNPYPIYYNHYPYIPYSYMLPSSLYLPHQFDYNSSWSNYYDSSIIPQVTPKSASPLKSEEVPKKLTDFSIRAITGL